MAVLSSVVGTKYHFTPSDSKVFTLSIFSGRLSVTLYLPFSVRSHTALIKFSPVTNSITEFTLLRKLSFVVSLTTLPLFSLLAVFVTFAIIEKFFVSPLVGGRTCTLIDFFMQSYENISIFAILLIYLCRYNFPVCTKIFIKRRRKEYEKVFTIRIF